MDPKKNAWMGWAVPAHSVGRDFFGGWWQVDPQRQTVMLWLQQTMPPQAPPGNSNAMGTRAWRKPLPDGYSRIPNCFP